VLHLENTEDHRLDNLITLCKNCFSLAILKRARKTNVKSNEVAIENEQTD
jgi:hypothetical protein